MALKDVISGSGSWGTALKLMLIGFLVLIFLIPLQMIKGLIEERNYTRMEAENEIVASWGGEQVINGPAITVPYITRITDEHGKTTEYIDSLFILPELLEISGTVDTELRNRGIFEVSVYSAELVISGSFKRPSSAMRKVQARDILWEDASLLVELADMRGLQEQVSLNWDGKEIDFRAGRGEIGAYLGQVAAKVPFHPEQSKESIPFSFSLPVHGGRSLSFVPLGEETRIELSSSWNSPSFNGSFLPASRDISDTGFTAQWYVLSLNRSYGQEWLGGEVDPYTVAGSQFGVEFMTPVDSYLKSLRSVKYGVLFIILPFLVFFLFESAGKKRIHAMQYLLVGLSVCMFFLLLVSVSEHITFDVTYLIASVCTLTVITVYSSAVLQARRNAWSMALALGSGYLFLFAALKSEDYALLIGSLGLFVVLSGVMVLTRKMDWYRIGKERGATADS